MSEPAPHPDGCRCRLCWRKARGTPAEWEWVNPAPPPRPAVAVEVVVIRPRCRWEGPVVEWCKTCTGAPAENRHVRLCLLDLDGWDVERCVRGASGSPEIQSCSSCPHHQPGGG